jgi:hypothetical protein
LTRKFEYQKLITSSDDTVEQINVLGNEGWEVVTIAEHHDKHHVWLKRERTSELIKQWRESLVAKSSPPEKEQEQ